MKKTSGKVFRRRLQAIVLACSLPLVFALFQKMAPGVSGQKIPLAGEKFKNVEVLKDMPADQMGKVMNIMNESLGVNCDFCHVGDDFEKEGKKEKEDARKMVQMTFAINKDFFNGKQEVSCNTCHNGRPHPLSAPNLNPGETIERRQKQPDTKPRVEDILNKYRIAIESPTPPPTSRFIVAVRIEPDGTFEPEEIWQKPGEMMIRTTYPNKYVVREGFNENGAWKTGNGGEILLKSDEEEQIRLGALLFANADLKSIYPRLEFGRLEKISGREVWMLRTASLSGNLERLFFDKITGLLVRRTTTIKTVLGDFVYQVDYSDYRRIGGVKIPVTTRVAMPAVVYTRKIIGFNANPRSGVNKITFLKGINRKYVKNN